MFQKQRLLKCKTSISIVACDYVPKLCVSSRSTWSFKIEHVRSWNLLKRCSLNQRDFCGKRSNCSCGASLVAVVTFYIQEPNRSILHGSMLEAFKGYYETSLIFESHTHQVVKQATRWDELPALVSSLLFFRHRRNVNPMDVVRCQST